ncbi:hypothetical protein Tco_0287325 [Tanacetum coccineum]
MVHNSEDTLEIAEITRKKMNDKMKTPLWTEQNINIRPLDYSKENYLATFTPQTQLTPEQIFWSKDVLKIKSKALKEQTKASTPITALTVYPPNTPAKLVPKVLPTKKHFEGIQKALINEIKEMKEVFDQMEAEMDQNDVDKKCDEIEFSDMHDAYTVAQKRIAELEAENSNLTQKIQKDDHDEMIKHFSKLDVEYLNLQLKYQHLKERFGNKKLVTSSDALEFESVFEIGNLKEQLQGKGNTIRELKAKITRLQKKHSEADPVLDLKALDSHNKDLNAKVNALHDLNERFRERLGLKKPLDSSLASACIYTKHSQELLEYVIGTCPKDVNKRDKKIATAPLNRKKRVTFVEPCETSPNNTQTHVEQQKMNKTKEPVIPSTRVNGATTASGSKPRINTKKDRTLPSVEFTKSKVVPVKQPENVSTSEIVLTGRFSSTSQKPLTRTPTEIGDPTFHTLRIRLFSNAGRTDRPLAFGLRLLKTYDGESLHGQFEVAQHIRSHEDADLKLIDNR